MTSTTGADSHPEVAEISDLTEGLLRSGARRRHPRPPRGLRAVRRCPGLPRGDPRAPRHAARVRHGCPPMSPGGSTRPSPPKPSSTPSRPVFHVEHRRAACPLHVKHAAAPRWTLHPASTGRGGRAGGRARGTDRRVAPVGACWPAASSRQVALARWAASSTRRLSSGGSSVSDSRVATKSVAGGSDAVEQQVRQLLAGKTSAHGANTPLVGGPEYTTKGGNHTDVAPNRAPHARAAPACSRPPSGPRHRWPPSARPSRARTPTSWCCPTPSDSSSVDAYVVSASCTASSPGTVLFQATYPR